MVIVKHVLINNACRQVEAKNSLENYAFTHPQHHPRREGAPARISMHVHMQRGPCTSTTHLNASLPAHVYYHRAENQPQSLCWRICACLRMHKRCVQRPDDLPHERQSSELSGLSI